MKKKSKKILLAAALLLAVMAGVFFGYVSDEYRADNKAKAVLQSAQVQVQDDMIILMPEKEGDTALIFYPGAKVEYTAYLPVLDQLRQNGISCILMKMPFNMAIFSPSAADKAYSMLPEVSNWFIGGHSMGGAMASSYFAAHQDQLRGLILLGAYIYGDVSPQDALTVYGTLNSDIEKHLDYTENVVAIEGGNHAQFGNYGEQRGDPAGFISREEQQAEAVSAILNFIKEKTKP